MGDASAQVTATSVCAVEGFEIASIVLNTETKKQIGKANMTKFKILSVAGVLGAAALAVASGSALAAECPIKIGGLAPLSAPGAVGAGG